MTRARRIFGGATGVAFPLAAGLLFLALTWGGADAAPRDPVALPAAAVDAVVGRYQPRRRVSPLEALSRHLEESARLAKEAVALANRPDRAPGARASGLAAKGMLMAAKAVELRALRGEVDARLERVGRRLAEAGSAERVARLKATRAKVMERFQRLERSLRAVEEAEGTEARVSAAAALRSIVAGMRPPRPQPKTGQRAPPMLRQDSPGPALELPASRTPPAYMVRHASPPTTLHAQLGELLLLALPAAAAAPPAIPSQASACAYTPADLADDGLEVRITDEIRALAEELGHSPARILEHVTSAIGFEPYYGSLKGAVGTLVSGAGGATDKASLLIALLRASNIPARYVRGDIDVLDETDLGANGRAARWLGTRSAAAAAARLARGRNPVAATISDGYDLDLMSVGAIEEVLDEGRSLVIVALVGTDLHIRIFDASGKKVVDKAENELISGEALTALKERLKVLPDESNLSAEDKREIIGNATSSAGHTLSDGTGIRLAHVWVEACVPYAHYRGAAVDAAGHRWVPLDPSFTDRRYQAGIATDVSFDYAGYLATLGHTLPEEAYADQVEAAIQARDPNLTLADVPYVGEPVPLRLDILPISLPYAVRRFTDWSHTGTPETAALPASHRYRLRVTANAGDASADLDYPAIALERVTLSFEGETTADQAALDAWRADPDPEAELPCNVGVDVVPVIHVAGDERTRGTAAVDVCATQQALDLSVVLDEARPNGPRTFDLSLQSVADTDELPNAARSLVIVALVGSELHVRIFDAAGDKVVDKAENELVGGDTLEALKDRLDPFPDEAGLSQQDKQAITADAASVAAYTGWCVDDGAGTVTVNATCFRNIEAGSYHAVLGHAFQTSDRLLADRAARLLEAVNANPAPNVDPEAVEGEFLHLVLLKYMRHVGDGAQRIAGLDGGSGDRGHDLGLTAVSSKVQYLFDLPFAVTRSGFLIDMPGGQSRSVDLTTGDSVWKTFLLTGYNASALEAYIWQENARLDAVSTVRGLQFAKDTGIEILVLDSANWDTEKVKLTGNPDPAYDYSEEQVSAMKAAYIDNGFTVTTPRSLIQYADWKGAVYVAEKDSLPARAKAAFIISGGYAGGHTVGAPVAIGSYDPVTGTGYRSAKPGAAEPLTARNLNNGMPEVHAADPVNVATGNFYHSERDIAIPGRGLPLVLERAYNSREPEDGPLGFGWTHSFHHYLRFNDDDYDTAIDADDGDGVTSAVSWLDGSGAEKYFAVTGTAAGVPVGADFTRPPGIYARLSREADGHYRIREKNGLTYTFAGRPGTVGQSARLLSIRDRNDNALTLAYDGEDRLHTVSDDLGRTLTFGYDDADARIDHVTDFTGRRFEYDYDGAGDLVAFRNPLAVAGHQAPVTYTYFTSADGPRLGHHMAGFRLPRGNGLDVDYYANGWVFRQTSVPLGETHTFVYNAFRRETRVTDPRGGERRFRFDPDGNPIEIVARDGGRQRYAYTDPADPTLRTAATDPLGHETRYAYDGEGNVTRITRPSAAFVAYADFDAFHQPRKIRDANGNVTVHQFDGRGNLTDVIALAAGVDPAAPADYDPTAHPAEVLAWIRHAYDGHGNRTGTTRVRDLATGIGPSLTYTYDTDHLYPVAVTRCGDQDGDGEIADDPCDSATLAYDSPGRRTRGIDADWEGVTRDYDALGRVIRGTDANGEPRDYRYDANGNLESETLTVDQNGVPTLVDQWAARYDPSDRIEITLDSGGHLTRYDYDAAGNLTGLTDPDGYRIGLDYDAEDRWVRAFDQAGHAVSRALDPGGRVRALTDPNGNATTYAYHGRDASGHVRYDGRLAQQCDALERCTAFGYDAKGNVTTVTDHLGRTTGVRYDALDRALRIVEPAYDDALLGSVHPVTCYTYDALGDLRRVEAGHTTNPDGSCAGDTLYPQALYTYDDFGRRLTETDANGKQWRYAYDVHGNLTERIDPEGRIVVRDYAYGGRLSEQRAYRHPGDASPHTIRYQRNRLGQPTEIDAPEVRYGYGYDTAHRLRSLSDSRGPSTLYLEWSPSGLLDTVTDNDGYRTDYLYDAVGRLIGIWAPNDDQVAFAYDAGGRLLEKWLPNGVDTRYAWNPDDSLATLSNRYGAHPSQLLGRHDYTYDAVGNRETLQETIGGVTRHYRYRYDPLNRLTEVRDGQSDTLIEGYGYDPFGNRRSRSDGATTRTHAYDAAHQLLETRDGNGLTQALVYDANGSLIERCRGSGVTRAADGSACTGSDTLALAYDALARLVRAERSGQPTETYAYGPLGRRIEKTVGALTTEYRYLGPDIHAEHAAGAATPTALYTHGAALDQPLIRATVSAGVPEAGRYYHADGLGSVVAMSGAAATRRNVLAEGGVSFIEGAGGSYLVGGVSSDPNSLADGDRSAASGHWTVTSGRSLEIVLPGPRTIDEVILIGNPGLTSVPLPDEDDVYAENTAFDTGSYTVQARDGGQWITVPGGSINGNTHIIRRIGFAPLTTDQLRIVPVDTSGDNLVSLAEVEIRTAPVGGGPAYQRFDAWGNATAITGSVPTYGYTGREPDATGLVYYRARYYDPEIGRFTQRDPLGFIDGINRYAYGINNPVNYTDPDGQLARLAGTWIANRARTYYGAARAFVGTLDQRFQNLAVFGDPDTDEQHLDRQARLAADYRARGVDAIADAVRDGELLGGSQVALEVMATGGAGLLRGTLARTEAALPGGGRAANGSVQRSLIETTRAIARKKAGFSDNGTPIILDTNLQARGLADALRAKGHNVRSVSEIFGKDVGDPGINRLANKIGARVLTRDRGRQIGEGFGTNAIQVDARVRSVDDIARILANGL